MGLGPALEGSLVSDPRGWPVFFVTLLSSRFGEGLEAVETRVYRLNYVIGLVCLLYILRTDESECLAGAEGSVDACRLGGFCDRGCPKGRYDETGLVIRVMERENGQKLTLVAWRENFVA